MPEDIALFEQSLHDLITRYEQYFLGLEKREPLKLLDEVERSARKYLNVNIVNTMLKFKFNSLVASFNTHKQKWSRINRLIEDGKYSRDRFKMAMHQDKASARQSQPSHELDAILEVEKIYQQYIEARKACNLPLKNVTPEMIASAFKKQKPAISAKYNCDRVEFRVVIEEGKPKIKARPGSSEAQ